MREIVSIVGGYLLFAGALGLLLGIGGYLSAIIYYSPSIFEKGLAASLIALCLGSAMAIIAEIS